MLNLEQSSRWDSLWGLDPEVIFLNHGSFGACPKPVLEVQTFWRMRMESEPVRFFSKELEGLLDNARATLAAFVGAKPEDLSFVPNATTGVNCVLRSLQFEKDDELLTTNHAYNACRNALDFIAERSRARVIVAEVPFPVDSSEEIVEAILRRVSPKTKLALLDHVTSPTGIIFPIQKLVARLSALEIDTLVDGAHAPGMLPLELSGIDAAYYTGNCHKWMCAPKGAAFLFVRSDKRDRIRPLTISHGANSTRSGRSRFHLEFDWTGTYDPTPYLCVPESIRLIESLVPGGWKALMAQNHQTIVQGRKLVCQTLKIPLPCPDESIGSMAAIPLPARQKDFPISSYFEPLSGWLFERYRIEVPAIDWLPMPARLIRISAFLYNNLAQYQYLADSLRELFT